MTATANKYKDLMGRNNWDSAQRLYDIVVDHILGARTASWTEINTIADMSAQVVAPATGNLTLTQALHGNRVLYYDDANGTIQLPEATGSGYKYKVVVKTPFTGASIEAASAGATFLGGLLGVDDDADAPYAWKAETLDDSIAGDGAATGGKAGDWYEFIDIATDLFLVRGFITQSGASEVTPFSAAA